MRPTTLRELKDKLLITEHQYQKLEPIYSNKIVSLYYELRIILYLGVMLFTTGMGILVYKNIGDIGHMVAIGVLFILNAWCIHYALDKAPRYSNQRTHPPTPYFDYIVLLGCLLFISVLGYLQFQYELFDDGMGLTTLITSAFFFYAAYRFDHLGVLSLAITALASFWSISISPQKWYSSDFLSDTNLHNIAIIFGSALSAIAILLDRRKIKEHFTFTYINFCSLIYLIGALTGVLMNEVYDSIYIALLFAGCAALGYFAHRQKSFLFMLYAFSFAYVGITYLLADVIVHMPELWFFYLLASCGAFVYFVIRFKSYFKRSL